MALPSGGLNPSSPFVSEKIVNDRTSFLIMRSALEIQRATFLQQYLDLGQFIQPWRPRFWTGDVNRGFKKNQRILDGTATYAMRTLQAGLMSSLTSPARQWFMLTLPDSDMANYGPVKEWLNKVTDILLHIFARSGIYKFIPQVYGDIGTFATAAMSLEEDFDTVIRGCVFPVGSYFIANNSVGTVRTFMRDFRLTVRQIVEKYGMDKKTGKINWDTISPVVQTAWKNRRHDTWVDLLHVVIENWEYNPKRLESKYKRYRSVTLERGMATTSDMNAYTGWEIFLRDAGYDYFPVLVPRWEINAEDAYGTNCPGMTILPDVRQLQMGEKRKLQAIEKMVNPPMRAPASMKQQKITTLPGDTTFQSMTDAQSKFEPSYQIDFRIQELEKTQESCRMRIKKGCFEDLFLAMTDTDRREITATEVNERKEEKLIALGPVLENVNQDFLDPLVEITYQIAHKQGLIPSAPIEIHGKELKVRYISILAQAQKLIGLAGMDRFFQWMAEIAEQVGDPAITDVCDFDVAAADYGDMCSVPPGVIRSQDKINAIRQQRAQQQQKQQQQQDMAAKADAAKKLAQAPMDGDTALTRLADQANAGNLVPQR